MTRRDQHGMCGVCGRRETEPCCDDCHRAHDYAWANATWAIGRTYGTTLEVQLAVQPPRRRIQD